MSGPKKTHLYGGTGMVLLLIGPSLTMFGLFVLWPAIDAIAVSLSSWTGFSPASVFTGFDNYRNLWSDSRFWKSFAHTLYFVLLGGIGHFVFAFLFASALNNPQFRAKKIYQTLVFFPSFISVAGVAILWARLYDPKDGLLNRIVEALGGHGIVWLSSDNAMNAVIISSIWAGVGGQMILLLAGMRRIPRDIYEAARIDGASESQVFWRITLPMLKDVTYVALSLWLIGSMQVFGLVQALAGPSVPLEMETVSTYQYAISFNNRDNIYMMGRGTAMSIVLVIAIVILAGLARLLFGKRELEY